MNNLLPLNPRNGEGCIRYPDVHKNGETYPSEGSCLEDDYNATVKKIEDLLDSLLQEYTGSKQSREVRQVDVINHEVITGPEMQFHKRLQDGISEILRQSQCWSTYGLKPRNSMSCAPFHLVFALGDLGGIIDFSKLDNEAMKELTRYWAICHPKRTLVLAPSERLGYMRKSWNEWIGTYKYWGGELDVIEVNIKAMGWNVSVGAVSKL